MQSIGPVSPVPAIQKGAAEQAHHPMRRAQDAVLAAGNAAVPNPNVPIVNPSLRYDLSLRLVVVEFFDDSGQVAHSIPTPRQLKAYESGANGRSGPAHAAGEMAPGTDEDGLAVVA